MSGDPFADLDEGATVRRNEDDLTAVAFALEVVQGPDRGLRHVVDSAQPVPVLVGQSPACDLRLTDREVSRRHVELYADRGRLHLRDLDSTNGTFVDDVAVLECWLRGGEQIRMGSTALKVGRVAALPDKPVRAERFGRFIGASREMQRLYPLIEKLTAATIPVVIEGETGTGKEVLAEAMHEASPRHAGPYVVFDCTAVPASLVESELFGHERGAFTTAIASRKGVFEQAHGGTLLIDEIGDLDIMLQPKLLRAIERSEIRRIGGDRWIQVDVRVLAATRRNLDREVQQGRFRDDLFHRLSVGRLELPPLRRRHGDVALLASQFWIDLGGSGAIPSAVLARWIDDPWPGNTRELRNAVARQIAVGDVTVGDEHEQPTSGRAGDFLDALVAERLPLPMARIRAVEELERRYIAHVLAEHDGNVGRAAAASGIGRRYFQMIRGRVKKR